MWGFRKKDSADQFKVDMDKLMKTYYEIIEQAARSLGNADMKLCSRFVDQYLICRRKYGSPFLTFVYSTFIAGWKEDVEKRRESLGRMSMLMVETLLATLLSGTGECPEMEELTVYMRKKAEASENRG